MRRTLAALLIVVGTGALAHAQAKDAKAAPPPAPTMSAEGKRFLAGWLGQWTAGNFAMTMGTEKMQGSLKMGCESVSAGWGTLCRGTLESPGAPPQAATLLFGWDIATGMGHMFEVMSSAEVHDHSGKWTDDKAITLAHQGKTLEGRMEKDSCTVTWRSASEIEFACTGTQAGATAWTMSMTLKK